MAKGKKTDGLTLKTETDEIKGFKLKVHKNAYMTVSITATKAVIIDFRVENEQSVLKAVYDKSPKFQKYIQAPRGYKAPWQP